MSTELKVVQFPDRNIGDVPRALRSIADAIEAGDYGTVNAFAWIMDADFEPVQAGIVGHLPSPDATFVTLCELGKLSILRRMGK